MNLLICQYNIHLPQLNIAPGNILNVSFNPTPIRRGPDRRQRRKAAAQHAAAANNALKTIDPSTKALDTSATTTNPSTKAANTSNADQDMEVEAESHWHEGEEITY
ncbi:hypothetical protein BGAL_0155g00140 [Botrytis galanthina]|uniref:Uncharacterized protein n=1 Tax=Botrytis galanthina TaxID=278940 RepID=A0A4S8QY83_9HELO|nr:hypothetical protein BGAL_0155g00140 [Botrytis galanthina]